MLDCLIYFLHPQLTCIHNSLTHQSTCTPHTQSTHYQARFRPTRATHAPHPARATRTAHTHTQHAPHTATLRTRQTQDVPFAAIAFVQMPPPLSYSSPTLVCSLSPLALLPLAFFFLSLSSFLLAWFYIFSHSLLLSTAATSFLVSCSLLSFSLFFSFLFYCFQDLP